MSYVVLLPVIIRCFLRIPSLLSPKKFVLSVWFTRASNHQSQTFSPAVSTVSTYAWYFLPFQVNLSCAIFKNFTILLFVSLFLSSWGSNGELDITRDEQGHFPLSPGVDGLRLHLNQTREQLKQKYKYNSPFSSAQRKIWEINSKHWTVVKPRRKRSVLTSLKLATLTSLKALLVMGD